MSAAAQGAGDEQPLAPLDWLLAVLVFAAGLALYVRTLAPSVLLGDSAEFQTLAYTLGMAHNTGYAVYLLLGKLLTLLPVGEAAWRVNLLSAVAAALTLAGVYLLARLVAGRRAYGLLAALALGINYLFWWQAVIAEVYTPAAAFVLAVLLLLALWGRTQRSGLLFAAGMVGGLAFGVHALVGLIAPAALAFLLAARARRRDWLRAFAGALIGLLLAAGAYFLIDARNDPSSIIHTFRAHANAFGLERADFDSPLTRIGFIVTARQWRDQILNSSPGRMIEAAGRYWDALLETFGPFPVALMLLGALWLLIRRPRSEGLLLGLAWLAMFLYVINYHIGDIQVFYVPTYGVLAVFMAAGLALIEQAVLFAARALHVESRYVAPVIGAVLALVVLFSLAPQRDAVFTSLEDGRISFLKRQDAGWPYPVHDPTGPRLQARRLASMIEEEDALVFLDWGMLYPFCYVAHVEQGRAGVGCIETMPYGTGGRVTESLRETLREEISRRPVYFGGVVPVLQDEFAFDRVSGPADLYRLKAR